MSADNNVAAVAALEAMRQHVEKATDSRPLFAAVWHVLRHHAPEWLQARFLSGWQAIQDADALTLDEGWGKPHEPNTRRGSVREKREANERAHAAVWKLVKLDPTRAIDEWLFEEAGERLPPEKGRIVSARTVSRRYYAALGAGALDLAIFKTATCQSLGESLTNTAARSIGKVRTTSPD